MEKQFNAGFNSGYESGMEEAAAVIAETRDSMGLALVGEEAAKAIRSAANNKQQPDDTNEQDQG